MGRKVGVTVTVTVTVVSSPNSMDGDAMDGGNGGTRHPWPDGWRHGIPGEKHRQRDDGDAGRHHPWRVVAGWGRCRNSAVSKKREGEKRVVGVMRTDSERRTPTQAGPALTREVALPPPSLPPHPS